MSMLDVTVMTGLGLGLGETRVKFDLGDRAALTVSVTSQGRFRRVRGIWVPRAGKQVDVVRHYLDPSTDEVIEPIEAARRSPRRMHAHTLHGRDVRMMLDAGTYDYDRGAVTP